MKSLCKISRTKISPPKAPKQYILSVCQLRSVTSDIYPLIFQHHKVVHFICNFTKTRILCRKKFLKYNNLTLLGVWGCHNQTAKCIRHSKMHMPPFPTPVQEKLLIGDAKLSQNQVMSGNPMYLVIHQWILTSLASISSKNSCFLLNCGYSFYLLLFVGKFSFY